MGLVSQKELAGLTPMMRQYYQLKERCQDAVLFFRMGDFYEIFGPEAEEIAPQLEIALTSRERGDQNKIPFCGVPHHSAQGYCLKLLKLGYKVAIADQVEDASQAKGLVKRDIVRVMTPGCIDEPEALEKDVPNYVMGVWEDPGTRLWAVCFADISTGELRLGVCQNQQELTGWLELYRPRELLCRRFCQPDLEKLFSAYQSQHSLIFSNLPEAVLRDQNLQKKILEQTFHSSSLKGQPCGEVTGGASLMSAALSYFESIQASTRQFLRIQPLKESDTFILNETAVRDLELFETSRSRKAEGSLFRQINHCMSPMGARLLRRSLSHPFQSQKAIQNRQESVKELAAGGDGFIEELRNRLQGTGDLERLSARIVGRRIRPLELARLRDSLGKAGQISALLSKDSFKGEFGKCELVGLHKSKEPEKLLREAMLDHPASSLGDGDGVFREGYDGQLDKLITFSRNGSEKVEQYLDQLKASTGIQSLKVKQHKTFGMVLEVTKSNLSKVPENFIRRQTMVNCERFVTSELKELDEALSTATDQAVERETQLYDDLLTKLESFMGDLLRVAQAMGLLDMLQSFAWLSLRHEYQPADLISHSGTLILEGIRHPVVEHMVGRHQFVPNNIRMGPVEKQLLITGPNMAGKSTVMRQIALAAILNQAGGVVPAQQAKLPVFDGIFTRVGASDDLSRGLSTFMVEMSEAAFILRNAGPRSLIILDEVGRGTSTEDGLAIASSILEFVATRLKSWTLFATHYHELVPFAERLSSVRSVQTEVLEQDGSIKFSHRLVPGASGCSYGLEVAQIAGIPAVIIDQAKNFLKGHEEGKRESVNQGQVKMKLSAGKINRASGGLFKASDLLPAPVGEQDSMSELTDKLEKIRIDKTTPIQALNILNELKSCVIRSSSGGLFQDRQT